MFDADDLLGAHPRRKFEHLLAKRCVASEPFALMLVDLDQFKSITAQHGTNTSDLLLFEVASRMRGRLSARDIVMRSGDNQFAVFVPALADIEKAERVAQALIERLETSMTVSGTRFRLTASIGITLFPQHGKDWKALLLSADTAAYDARTLGRGRISVSIPAVS
jgi:diguanylate cyclase (GGDEF)-like protein